MKQVIQNMRSGELSVADVPAPQCGAGEIQVALEASLISAGTERMLIDFANKSLLGKAQERPDLVRKVMDKMQRDGLQATVESVFNRLDEPLPLGYSAAGKVLAVGERVRHKYQVGERVAVAGAGLANHAEVVTVPQNLVVPVPAELPAEQACFATVSAIAMQGFRNSGAVLGDRVLVLGLGLVGQLVLQQAVAAGCRVAGADFDAGRISLAQEQGAHLTLNLGKGDVTNSIASFTDNRGFDTVIICAATDSDEPVRNAADWARDKARIVLVGKVGITLPYADYMKKELEFVISRSYGPGRYDDNYERRGQQYPAGFVPWTERDNLAESIRLMAQGQVDVAPMVTHRYPIEEAEEAYGLITSGKVPHLGVVLTYNRAVEERLNPKISLAEAPFEATESETLGIGMIGVGGFSRSVLLPKLKQQTGTMLTGIMSKGGMQAAHSGKKYGFAYAAGESASLYNDAETHAVVVATRHDTHAQYVQEALGAKKHVFVEKPLAMTLDELEAVQKAHQKAGKVLMVGYNRRFAPLTQELQTAFADHTGARQVFIRVNAGRLPEENWQNDPSEGGGRLIGEVCHFIDLAYALAGSEPTSFVIQQGEGQDVFAITLKFENGGVAQVFYTSEGDTSFSKEYVEVYGGGKIGVIDNFRLGWVTENGRKRKLHQGIMPTQDKGHSAELAAFIAACRGEQEAPIAAQELFTSAKLTLLAPEALKTGTALEL